MVTRTLERFDFTGVQNLYVSFAEVTKDVICMYFGNTHRPTHGRIRYHYHRRVNTRKSNIEYTGKRDFLKHIFMERGTRWCCRSVAIVMFNVISYQLLIFETVYPF